MDKMSSVVVFLPSSETGCCYRGLGFVVSNETALDPSAVLGAMENEYLR